MPNRLEPSLYNCDHKIILRNAESLLGQGLSQEEVYDILEEIESWLAKGPHFAPDVWEGEEGWYKQFDGFVIEGDTGATCISRIHLKSGNLRKWKGVDLDRPGSWKPSKRKT